MPRFHFHISDQIVRRDEEGTELSDLTAARREAVKLAGAMVSERAEHFWRDDDWKLDVTDDRGLLLFSLVIMGFDAPSTAKVQPA